MPGDEEKGERRTKAYFFQCVALGVFALIIMGAAAKVMDVTDCDVSDCTALEWVLAGTVLIIAGAAVAIVFYCCDCNPLIKFGIVGLLVVGSLCYFMGAAENMDKDDDGSQNAKKGAVAVGLFLTVVVTSVQVLSEAFNDEKRRVPAFAFAMLMFGLLYPWHLFDIDPRTDAQNAIIAGCLILDLSLIATMVIFACKEVVRVIRIILCFAIFAGSLVMFSGLWKFYGVDTDYSYSDAEVALIVLQMEPGIFCLIQSGILALDVLV